MHEDMGTPFTTDQEKKAKQWPEQPRTWSSLSPMGMEKPRRSVVPEAGLKKNFHSRVTRPSTCAVHRRAWACGCKHGHSSRHASAAASPSSNVDQLFAARRL